MSYALQVIKLNLCIYDTHLIVSDALLYLETNIIKPIYESFIMLCQHQIFTHPEKFSLIRLL